ncbi:UDP-N-acetylglucosamine--N-acetylmuramyl-(pentapeptide) pyrophosphoryl-UDP N-acetylglucosamine transferase [Neosynechococcus sphagnicola sy1]|uniref:UDP-N-acetylglucosamine--N-acetylmuramyl-(pentapeptide) pyrophosphoryl-undecaprenol N-acetylglucosamine transferase n=1 Tax=Neosynechococcus sphagnicola sy1 TaxID=1497020 RepID=A0A098TPZ9_9CYAN|nr:undecaprenyldiphospho-muramoylpentapeptide beta-N-acetylglucosaminyltransferase [Neosynechococcus sphagnicola]KGF72903.1 UDP-N-acetylglucosamine--N-acetylmuramyl-(pentapeptide) pyrophosphoryl-UDP N-acetylglucosamine transferase [Neosynechococcus sphagnicola sy1]
MTDQRPTGQRLLIAASGTGGHLFPAIATAEQLPDFEIEWLGVSDRLETQLVPSHYPLHTIAVTGLQKRFGLETLRILWRLMGAVFQVRKLLQQGQFRGVLTTGGYIAAPAILAARSLGLPVVLHESNAIPGKVTRFLAWFCSRVAVGFPVTARALPTQRTVWVGTPVRSQFRQPTPLSSLEIPPEVPLIVGVGGSQGAIALNRLIRQCAPAWLAAGAWVVHLTGDSDPDAHSLIHPHYVALPFYDNMAGLLQRASLAVSRAGAGTLTELAVTGTPAILIPYPYAAEDHQTHNAASFAAVGAGFVYQQADLTPEMLETQVLALLHDPTRREQMAHQAASLAVTDSAEQLAMLVRQSLAGTVRNGVA